MSSSRFQAAGGCRLILNADDFGWSSGANEAIAVLHDAGVVTSASLMVGGPAAEEAISLARERPRLAVGLHLALVHGYPLLPREEVSLLVDGEERLPRSYARAGLLYTCSPAHRRQWRREMEAQFAAFAATGLPWSHVDSHVHFSLTPGVFADLLPLLRRYTVPGFRIPEDDLELYRRLDPADARRQSGMAAWFGFQCRRQRRVLAKSGLVLPRRCCGFFRSERLDEPYLVRLTEALPDGLHELHCHPRTDTAAGQRELEALASPGFRAALERRGVRLTRYVDEAPGQ